MCWIQFVRGGYFNIFDEVKANKVKPLGVNFYVECVLLILFLLGGE
jgi:hypothetical protein